MAGSARRMEIMSPAGRERGVVRSLLLTLLIVVLIVLTTIFFAVRTEGGRSLVEDRLGRVLGMELRIERARIGWPYALVIEGPVSKDLRNGRPAFRAQWIRLALDGAARWQVQVYRGELILENDARGEWSPSFFARMGPLPDEDIGRIENVTAPFRERWSLEVSDGTIRWIQAEEKEKASATGVDFRMEPVRVPGRRMVYCRLALDALVLSGQRYPDLEREWLMSDMDPYLELRAPRRMRNGASCPWLAVPPAGGKRGAVRAGDVDP